VVSVFFFLVVSCCIPDLADAAKVPRVRADNISIVSAFFMVFYFIINCSRYLHNYAKKIEMLFLYIKAINLAKKFKVECGITPQCVDKGSNILRPFSDNLFKRALEI
jgi:hypothetical protein